MNAVEPLAVSEADATGSVADSFAVVRRCLDSTFVPTVYRQLAVHPDALAAAVGVLPMIVEAAERHRFTDAAVQLAASSVVRADVPTAAPAAALPVVLRYRRANPLNLLFAVALMGVQAGLPPAMEPPLPPRSPEEDADMVACHGGVVLPGLWRELAVFPAWRSDAWSAIREDAAAGRLVAGRAAVLGAAYDLAGSMPVAEARHEVRALLPQPAADRLGHFPIVIASMVVEAEWLIRSMNTNIEE